MKIIVSSADEECGPEVRMKIKISSAGEVCGAEKELRLNSYDVVSSHLIPSCSLLVRQDQSDYGR